MATKMPHPPASESQPSPAAAARRLIRSLDRASLATVLAGPGVDWPYASLVLLACDLDASPLLLMSDLAEHSKNLARNPRASLLVDGTAGRDDPLTGARATILGEIRPDSDPALLERFVRRHPTAATYAGFKDFRLYRMTVSRAHLVAGFGRIDWVEAADLLYHGAGSDWLRPGEAGVLQHMNDDHAEAVDLYAQRLLGRTGAGWRLTGVDAEGSDLRRGGEVARLDFATPLNDPETARQVFAALAQSARRSEPSR